MQEDVQVIRLTHTIDSEKFESDVFVIPILISEKSTIIIDELEQAFNHNTLYFIHPEKKWTIKVSPKISHAGFLLLIKRPIMDNPLLSKLHIAEVRLFGQNDTPKIHLAPGIEKRVLEILEMLDELISSHLNHKEDAILSLLNTLFVYCDGQCNVKSVFTENSAKNSIVYRYKRLLTKYVNEYSEVEQYAKHLNITPKYLNECVKGVLGVNAKGLITEQRLMKARHELKFSNKSIKEIGFELGFTSADYFSSFYKKNTGMTPSMVRND